MSNKPLNNGGELNSSLVDLFKDGLSLDPLQLEEVIKKGVNLNGPLSLEDGSRPLHIAAREGNVKVVQMLLDHGAYVDVPDYYGNTPAHHASREGHIDVLKLLIDRNANVYLRNDQGCTGLELAVYNEHLGITRLLLFKGVSGCYAKSIIHTVVENDNFDIHKEWLKKGVKAKRDWMSFAVKKGNIELIEILIENGAAINDAYLKGENSPLGVAIKAGMYKVVVWLLDKGAKVDGNFFLFTALSNGQCEIAKLLVDKGAKLAEPEMAHALSTALRYGFIDSVKLILTMKPHALDKIGSESRSEFCPPRYVVSSALHYAVISRNIEIVHLVIQNSIEDVNSIEDYHGKTPLILATERASIPIIQLLIEHGADVSLCDGMDKTALHYALLHEDSFQIAEVLLNHGASVNDIICEETDTTPLHLAARANNVALIEFLLQRMADVNARDKFGNTPLHALFDNNLSFDTESLTTCAKRLLEAGGNIVLLNYEQETPMIKAVNNLNTVLLRTFLEITFSVVKHGILSSITSKVLHDMILNGHILLVKLVLKKVAELQTDGSMELSNISFVKIFDEVGLNSVSREGLTTLQLALYRSDFVQAKNLVNKGASLQNKDSYNLLPLQIAIVQGDTTLVEMLYNKTCQNISSVFGVPILNLAAYHGNVNLVRYMFRQLSDINTRDENMNTILHIAVKVQNIELINFAIENGVDINAQNSLGDTAFHTSLKVLEESKSSDFEIVMNLLNQGVDINTSNSEMKTPLHLATAHNLTPIIEILLKTGIKKINAKDSKGNTPLEQLILNLEDEKGVPYDATRLIILFLKYGADAVLTLHDLFDHPSKPACVNFDRLVSELYSGSYLKRQQYVGCIVYNVLIRDNFDLLESLLIQGLSFNKDLHYGGSSLRDIIFEGNFTDAIKLILKYDKTIEIKSSYLCTAIEHANVEMVKILLDKLDINCTKFVNGKRTIFQEIICNREHRAKYGLAQVFLDRGVNVNNTNPVYGCVPLVEAVDDFNSSLVNILLDKGADINAICPSRRISSFQLAVIRGYTNFVKLLLARGAIVNDSHCKNLSRPTYLHWAADGKDSEITKLLLENGAKTNVFDINHMTALHVAAESGNHVTVELLVRAGADITAYDKEGSTPLHKAKSFKVAEILIGNGGSVNQINFQKQTPLHSVIAKVRLSDETVLDIAELMIRNGALVNEQDKNGQSPLHLAAKTSNLDLVSILVSKGADVDLRDTIKWTPLIHAIDKNKTKNVEYLLSRGASPEVKLSNGYTSYHLAARIPNLDILSVLISKCANLDIKDSRGWTPLHHAVYTNKPRNVEYLLNHGSSVEIKTFDGETPLHLAVNRNSTDVLLLLIKKGAMLDVKNTKNWNTALHQAIHYDNSDAVFCLLYHGALTSVKNKDGKTPLRIKRSNKTFSSRLLTAHIEKLKLAGLSIDEVVESALSNEDKESCLKELERMKITKVRDKFYLIDVFSKIDKPSYLLEKDTMKKLKKICYAPNFHAEFPMYKAILRTTIFVQAKRSRYYLMKRATSSMMSATRKVCCQVTPDLVWEYVFGFLHRIDLINVIKSAK